MGGFLLGGVHHRWTRVVFNGGFWSFSSIQFDQSAKISEGTSGINVLGLDLCVSEQTAEKLIFNDQLDGKVWPDEQFVSFPRVSY